MKKIKLDNNHIMVKEVVRTEEESINSNGFFIPKQSLDDEQVATGVVVESGNDKYPDGMEVLFHKVLPVDFNMKLNGDAEITTYYFIKESDVICRFIEE